MLMGTKADPILIGGAALAAELQCSKAYITTLMAEGLLTPQNDKRPFQFRLSDGIKAHRTRAERSEKNRLKGLAALRTRKAKKNRKAALKARRETPGLSTEAAARRQGVNRTRIERLYLSKKLPALSQNPRRFAAADIDKQFVARIKEGEITIASIPGRVPGSDDDTLKRVRSIIRYLRIPTFKRRARNAKNVLTTLTCIYAERLPEIVARFTVDPPRPGELTIKAAQKEFRRARETIKTALAAYAPDAGRERSHIGGRGRELITVYPRTAIESALEKWGTRPPRDEATGRFLKRQRSESLALSAADEPTGNGQAGETAAIEAADDGQGNGQAAEWSDLTPHGIIDVSSDAPLRLDPKAFYEPLTIAAATGRKPASVRVKLDRLRRRLKDADYVENMNRRARQSGFKYRWGAVEDSFREP